MITSRLGRQGQIRECTIGFVGFCCYLNFGKSERCRTPISKVETFFFFFRKDLVEENKNKNNMLCGSTDASTSIDLPEHSSYLAYSRKGSDSFQSDTFYAIAI